MRQNWPPGSNGAGFELSFGPALVDNNIFIASGGGTGITGMDASGVTYVHNLVHGYEGSISVYGLTGRTCGSWGVDSLDHASVYGLGGADQESNRLLLLKMYRSILCRIYQCIYSVERRAKVTLFIVTIAVAVPSTTMSTQNIMLLPSYCAM